MIITVVTRSNASTEYLVVPVGNIPLIRPAGADSKINL